MYGFEGTTAVLIFGVGAAAIVGLALLFIRVNVLMLLFVAALFLAGIGTQSSLEVSDWQPLFIEPLLNYKYPVYVAVVGLMYPLLLMRLKHIPLGSLSMQTTVLLILAVYMGTMRFVHEGPMSGLLSVGLAVGSVTAYLLIIPALLRTEEDMFKLVRLVMLFSAVWTATASLQFVITPEPMLYRGRFAGLLGNPQHAATMLASMVVFSLWLTLNDPQKRAKPLWIGLLAINMIFLLWTGSRTGAGMTVVGSLIVLSTRFKKAIFFAPVGVGLFFVLAFLADALNINEQLNRLTTTKNTRAGAWAELIAAAMRNPIIGNGIENAGATENGYLLALSAYGIGAFLLVVIFVGMSAHQMFKVWRLRNWAPDAIKPIATLVIAFTLTFLAGAVFEGYLVGRLTIMMLLMYTIGGIGTRYIELAKHNASLGQPYPVWDPALAQEYGGEGYDDHQGYRGAYA